MADPLFTRMLEPVRAVAPLPPARPRPKRARVAHKAAAALAAAKLPMVPQPDLVSAESSGEPAQPEPQAQDQTESEQTVLEPLILESAGAPPVESGVAPDSWPVDTRVSYQLRGFYQGNLYGDARVQWQRQHSRYQVRIDLSMALVLRVSMISQGEMTDEGLVPSAYEEQFPWGVRHLAFESGYVKIDNGTPLPHPKALQDTASQFVELSRRFSSGRDELKVGTEVRLWLARPQGMALWTYDVIEEETLQTPGLGSVPAFHLRPRPIDRPSGAITAEIWFAPSLQYLPVRVRISLGAGNFVDLMAERIEQGEPAPVWVAQPINP